MLPEDCLDGAAQTGAEAEAKAERKGNGQEQASCEQKDLDHPVEVLINDDRQQLNLQQEPDQSSLEQPKVGAEFGFVCRSRELSETCGTQRLREELEKTRISPQNEKQKGFEDESCDPMAILT